MASFLLFGNLTMWLTPVWLLSVGVTIGAAILLVLYGLIWFVSRRAAEAVTRVVRESVLLPITYMAAGVRRVLSARRDGDADEADGQFAGAIAGRGTPGADGEVPPKTEDFEVPIAFRADELQRYSFESNRELVIDTDKGQSYSSPLVEVAADEPFAWTPSNISPALLRRHGHRSLRDQRQRRAGQAAAQHPNRRRDAGSPSDSDHGGGGGRHLSGLFSALLAAAGRVDHRVGDRQGSDRSAAVHPGDARRGVCLRGLHLHPLQHVRRRRQDAQGFGADDDHGAGDPRRAVDGERVGRRRNRGQDGRHAALEADQPAAVRDRQVLRHRLAAVVDVHRARRDPADHDFVQSGLRRPRNIEPDARLAAMLRAR